MSFERGIVNEGDPDQLRRVESEANQQATCPDHCEHDPKSVNQVTGRCEARVWNPPNNPYCGHRCLVPATDASAPQSYEVANPCVECGGPYYHLKTCSKHLTGAAIEVLDADRAPAVQAVPDDRCVESEIRADERERACQAMCWHCRAPERLWKPATFGGEYWTHQSANALKPDQVFCSAAAIRNLPSPAFAEPLYTRTDNAEYVRGRVGAIAEIERLNNLAGEWELRFDLSQQRVAELERERDELLANNMRSFIAEIKSRLLPEEAEEFQRLLTEAGNEWMREVLRNG